MPVQVVEDVGPGVAETSFLQSVPVPAQAHEFATDPISCLVHLSVGTQRAPLFCVILLVLLQLQPFCLHFVHGLTQIALRIAVIYRCNLDSKCACALAAFGCDHGDFVPVRQHRNPGVEDRRLPDPFDAVPDVVILATHVDQELVPPDGCRS